MNFGLTLHVIGGLLSAFSFFLLIPALASLLIFDDGEYGIYFTSFAVSLVVGGLFYYLLKSYKSQELTRREGFGIVTLSWLIVAALGAVPYFVSGVLPHWIDAYFESMSGFTTTGATVINDLSQVAPSTLLWRSMTQWIGGMGIIVLAVAILPWLGVGGMQLFHAETPGPSKSRLSARVEDTAKVLWMIYGGLTILVALMLLLSGLNLFEAICHALTTVSTGGFSTRNGSIGEFNNPMLEWVVTVFMLVAGVNFFLHYRFFSQSWRSHLNNAEFRAFASIVGLATALIVYLNNRQYPDVFENLRDAAFQVASLVSSTGFITADYDLWASGCQMTLLALMVMGGCSGSTAGGIKVVRMMLIVRYALSQMFLLLHRKAMVAIRYDEEVVSREVIGGALGMVLLFVISYMVSSVVVAHSGVDFMTATTSVLACLGNIGPGFANAGPTETFAGLPMQSKIVLTFCMLVGRLEYFTVLVMLVPSFWRR